MWQTWGISENLGTGFLRRQEEPGEQYWLDWIDLRDNHPDEDNLFLPLFSTSPSFLPLSIEPSKPTCSAGLHPGLTGSVSPVLPMPLTWASAHLEARGPIRIFTWLGDHRVRQQILAGKDVGEDRQRSSSTPNWKFHNLGWNVTAKLSVTLSSKYTLTYIPLHSWHQMATLIFPHWGMAFNEQMCITWERCRSCGKNSQKAFLNRRS
jgi:hypothetical protein